MLISANSETRRFFNDRVQQGEISFVTVSELEMKEIREEFSKAGKKIPSCLNLVFAISYQSNKLHFTLLMC